MKPRCKGFDSVQFEGLVLHHMSDLQAVQVTTFHARYITNATDCATRLIILKILPYTDVFPLSREANFIEHLHAAFASCV